MKEKEINIKPILEWIKRDYVLIIVSLIFILSLLVVLNQQGSYQKQCNDHWREEIIDNCKTYKNLCAAFMAFNNTIEMFDDYNETFKFFQVQ